MNAGDLVENTALNNALGVIIGHVTEKGGEDYYLCFYAEYEVCMIWTGSCLNVLSSAINFLTD